MAGGLEGMHGAHDVAGEVVDGPLDRGDDVADAGEVENVTGAPKKLLGRGQVPEIADLDGERGVGPAALQVSQVSAGEVVEGADPVAPVEEQVHHVAADEAGGPGHHGDLRVGHFSSIAFTVRTLTYLSSSRLLGSFPAFNASQMPRTASSMLLRGT